MKDFIMIFLVTLSLTGCFQKKTFLSDELRNVNPYERGQRLIFISSVGNSDTLTITEVEDGRFPDGMGSPRNEHLVVNAFRKSVTVRDGVDTRILTLLAKQPKYGEQIDFSFSLKETSLNMQYISFSDYQQRATAHLETEYDSYSDVLFFENYSSRKIFDSEIVQFWWSKSKGYVRLVQKDGVIWDLKPS